MKKAMSKMMLISRQWLIRNKKILLRMVGVIALVFIVAQVFYPGDKMPLGATIDGVNVGGWHKKDAIWELNERARQQVVRVHVGQTNQVYDSPKTGEIGLKIDNTARVEQSGYPWYLRLVPTSLLWYGPLQPEGAPMYVSDSKQAKQYLESKLGASCSIPPKNATLLFTDKLKVVAAKDGGSCKETEALAALAKVRPTADTPANVTIPVTISKPKISDDQANKLAEQLTQNTENGVKLSVKGKDTKVEQREILSWLTFDSKDSPLRFEVSAKKATPYLSKRVTPAIAVPSGVTKISTTDFTITSKKVGATGKTLAVTRTLGDITKVLEGTQGNATAFATDLPPKVTYKRSYSKTSTGMAALIQHFDTDNAGVFGVSFQELSGSSRSASHNGSKQFVTASTYKLFVAFSTLRFIDNGKYKWIDKNIAGGRNLSQCFDDMIVKSDNACAEALLKKIGRKQLDADIKRLGLQSSTFQTANNMTTANDLGTYLSKLQRASMPLKADSRNRLLGAMKRNVYRQGIPSGASGQVADKVGFLWGLLHDAAIVYSPKGTYTLAVMSDGSSWGKIAELTRKIESLR